MNRAYNFAPGPCMLPEAVMERLQAEFPSWQNGMSAMEVSHRGEEFLALASECEARARRLLNIPEEYACLWPSGGAHAQNSAIPLNLEKITNKGDYVVTGHWGDVAAKEAARLCDCQRVFDAHGALPDFATLNYRDGAYLHYVTNETISGVQQRTPPAHPFLVADMTSDIFSYPVDVSKFSVMYASAQKNFGIAGITLVIVRKDLLDAAADTIPNALSWANAAQHESMFNTPATFAWYVANVMLTWLEDTFGDLAAVHEHNQAKAARLYDYLDGQDFYRNKVAHDARSLMNVPFFLPDDTMNAAFIEGANARGLRNLKGHRVAGGMRASIYNAMPVAGIDALLEWMEAFRQSH